MEQPNKLLIIKFCSRYLMQTINSIVIFQALVDTNPIYVSFRNIEIGYK